MQNVIDRLIGSVCGEIGHSLRDYTIEHAELVGRPLYILPDGTFVSDTAWNHWMLTRRESDMGFRWGCYVIWAHAGRCATIPLFVDSCLAQDFWTAVEYALTHFPDGVRFAPGVSHLQLSVR